MATIDYGKRRIPLQPGETVLDALLRAGADVPSGCRSGVCRSCTLVATAGTLPPASQAGMREVERRQGLFLACQCRPEGDLEVRGLDDGEAFSATVVEHDRLSESVVRLRLRTEAPLSYEAGQYLAVRRADGLTRSYSLASLPSEPWLELHVRKLPDGRMSTWLYDQALPGTPLQLQRAHGSCCYPSEQRDAPLLLVGVGTGLAPLWGVVRQALASGHAGPITLIQAAASPSGLYMRDQLAALARAHPQLEHRACVLTGEGPGLERGEVDRVAANLVEASAKPAAWLAFLCGDAPIVDKLHRALFLAGLSHKRILADPFLLTPTTTAKAAC